MGTALGRIERANRSRRQPRRAPPVLSLPLGEDEDGLAAPDCPVCMNSLGNAPFAFPCGHCVCTGCDAQLQQRGYYACPTCRQPREGVTRAQVDAAANARVRREELSEQRNAPHHEGSFVEHNGHTYQVVFLRDESSATRPFDVLRSVGVNGIIDETTETAEHGAGGHRRVGIGQEPVVIDLTGDDSGVDAHTIDNGNGILLSGPLAQMVQELLQPNNLPDFLRRHDALTSLVTAVNARPRMQ